MANSCFKVNFDTSEYKYPCYDSVSKKYELKSVIPDISEYLRNDTIINEDQFVKGNIENCFWQKHVPTSLELGSDEFKEREVRRILKTGAWIANKEEILWLPPNYYTALQYGKVGEVDLGFRLKRLKHVYFKIMARNNPNCIGTLTIKNRADGETTMAISDAMWEMMDGITRVGGLGIQSKTREDAINPCWSTAQVFWQSYPKWFKHVFYPDFVSGSNIAQKMQFMREGNEEKGILARNIRFQYYPCVYNAMDGRHNMKRCILDEICKWVEAQFMDTYINYRKFILPGMERRGIFDMFSSPSDVPTKSNDQVKELWDMSDPKGELDETGTTLSRILRHYSNPLDGIQGSYDKYGDVDPDRIYNNIMRDRKAAPKDKKMGEIRGYPLNENEMFGSFDNSSVWRNQEGIEERKIYLLGTRFKNETNEPKVVYGNLEWRDGATDSDVVFRPSDLDHFDENVGRFCFSYPPKKENKMSLRYGTVHNYMGIVGVRPLPPFISLVEGCLGVDGYAKRHRDVGAVNSKGAMVLQKFRDFLNTGIVKCPTMIYSNRPTHDAIFHEDCIRAAIFNRSLVQPESIADKVIDYFEDRGYMDWMLPKRGHTAASFKRGDAPSGGRNAYLAEIIGLIDAATSLPLDGEKYQLLDNWFYELLDDVSRFNRKVTTKNDLSMAWGAAFVGVIKILSNRSQRGGGNILDDVVDMLR